MIFLVFSFYYFILRLDFKFLSYRSIICFYWFHQHIYISCSCCYQYFSKFFIHSFCIIIFYPVHQFFFCQYSFIFYSSFYLRSFHWLLLLSVILLPDKWATGSLHRQVQDFCKSICQIPCSGVQVRLKDHRTFSLPETMFLLR